MKVVIFDFDGVIADSFDFMVNIIGEIIKSDNVELSLVKEGRDSGADLKEAVKRLHISKLKLLYLFLKGRRLMAKRMSQISLQPDLANVLANLYKQKIKLIIVSSNIKSNINKFLAERGIANYFDEVISSKTLYHKSRAIKRYIVQHNLSNEDVIYVGDEVRDIEAGREANIPVIAVTWGYNSEASLLSAKPMVLVRKPAQLEKALTDWAEGYYKLN